MSDIVNSELLEAFLEDARDVLEEWERVCLNLTTADGVAGYEPLMRCAHNLKGSAGLAGLQALHKKLHQIEDHLVKLRDRAIAPAENVVAILLDVERVFRRWVEGLKRNPKFEVDTGDVEKNLAGLAMGLVDSGTATATATSATSEKSAPSITPGRREVKTHATPSTKGEDTVRVSAAKLDHLIQLVGEISLHQSIIDRASREGTLDSASIRNVVDVKTKLTQDLQDAALSLRMVPLTGLFQKIERVARETAAKLNKQVFVTTRGEEVTLDKIVVENMLDPLIHIARNAIDHGIEAPEERKAKGKAERGSITLSADHSASGVNLIFEDDGRGIDGERVYQKALETGLISKDQHLTEEAKLQLIFLPGLSTAKQVTEVSGRGVGMDVVADVLKRMAGRLEVDSRLGKGTRFTISLPTNLSIIDALVVKVGGCQYAIPTQDLSEVIDLRDMRVNELNAGQARAIELRGEVVPIAEMVSFLENRSGAGAEPEDAASPKPGIVIQHRETRLALAVDSVVGQQQIFVRPLMGHLAPVGFYGGSTILSDGEPSIILNLPEMADRFFNTI